MKKVIDGIEVPNRVLKRKSYNISEFLDIDNCGTVGHLREKLKKYPHDAKIIIEYGYYEGDYDSYYIHTQIEETDIQYEQRISDYVKKRKERNRRNENV